MPRAGRGQDVEKAGLGEGGGSRPCYPHLAPARFELSKLVKGRHGAKKVENHCTNGPVDITNISALIKQASYKQCPKNEPYKPCLTT